jgi:hypothetical protein
MDRGRRFLTRAGAGDQHALQAFGIERVTRGARQIRPRLVVNVGAPVTVWLVRHFNRHGMHPVIIPM